MLLHEYMEYFGREIPDHPCVEMEGTAYSYAEANRRCNQIAHACMSAGLKQGDRLAWLSKNSIDLMLIFYAASKLGGSASPAELPSGSCRVALHH